METIKTLSEVYKNGSDEVRQILEGKFTDEELGVESDQNTEPYVPLIRRNIEFF